MDTFIHMSTHVYIHELIRSFIQLSAQSLARRIRAGMMVPCCAWPRSWGTGCCPRLTPSQGSRCHGSIWREGSSRGTPGPPARPAQALSSWSSAS
eukprot:scaffold185352_cov45-Prasinocladus_malaysianus.AAC.1